MISMKCVHAMSDDPVVFGTCFLARQGQSESELRISMKYVFSVFDEKGDDEALRNNKIART